MSLPLTTLTSLRSLDHGLLDLIVINNNDDNNNNSNKNNHDNNNINNNNNHHDTIKRDQKSGAIKINTIW